MYTVFLASWLHSTGYFYVGVDCGNLAGRELYERQCKIQAKLLT